MNKELEQQADHIAAIREALEDARIVVGNTHLINVALSSLESLEAQSKPIQGEVPTVPLSPEMVEKIMEVVDPCLDWSGGPLACKHRRIDLCTRLLGIR